jgi:hypothetical protein
VTFSFTGNKARGQVGVGDGTNNCRKFVPVQIQQRRGGSWSLLDTTATNASGRYNTWVPSRQGTFRAKVRKLTLADGTVCRADVSPTRHHG